MEPLRHATFGLAAGVGAVAYLYPYFAFAGEWWRAIPSTLAIVGVALLVCRRRALDTLGLRVTPAVLVKSLLVFLGALLVSRTVLGAIVANSSLTAAPNHSTLGAIHQLFQVLNDEMVVRAALLTLVLRVMPQPRVVAIACALLFSFAHHVVYRLSGAHVEATALMSLFFFGGLANLLFLRFGHIGYGFALHYAWNLPRFGAVYFADRQLLSEGTSFNYLEGDWRVATLSAGMFGLVLFMDLWKPHSGSLSLSADAPEHQDTGSDQ